MEKVFPPFFNGENRGYEDASGYYSVTNADIHTELGMVSNQIALTTESSTPNESCISEIVSNGDVFFFSTTSGKVWKRTNAGVYSLVHTNTQGANVGCHAWQGYLYYATTTELGRITTALASSQSTWSSQVDTYATFTVGGTHKPMTIQGSGLYIGDGYLVAVVDQTHTFTAEALNVRTDDTISALGNSGDDLIIGTIIGNNVPFCRIYSWNRISPSWTWEDVVPEIGINTFVKADGEVIFQAGTSGQLWSWGVGPATSTRFLKIKGVTTSVNPYNSTEFQGRPLLAIGTKVYSIFRFDSQMPRAIACEYTAGGTIKSIISNTSKLLVSDGTTVKANTSGTYGTIVLETYEVEGSFKGVEVKYRSIEDGTTIGIETNVDNAGYVSQTTKTDTINKRVYFDGGLGKVNFLQARITITGLAQIKSIKFV